jgi:hypothetical protein
LAQYTSSNNAFVAVHESGYGTKQTFAAAQQLSAFGGKAEPLACVNLLPPDQAAPFWQAAQAQAF